MDTNQWQGAVTRGELIAEGHSPSEIRTALHDNTMRSLAPGIYASPALWNESMETRHGELSKATLRKLGGNYVLGAQSAAAVYGLPLWGVDPRVVHLVQPTTNSGTGSRNSKRIRIHRDARRNASMRINGVLVSSPARAIVDLARRTSTASAVVTGDAALHRGLCTVTELLAELDLIAGFPGHPKARRAVEMMDARSESALESRSRVSMHDARLPMPTLQYEVLDNHGRFLARVDFAWVEHRVIGEADGVVKYENEDVRSVLDREKYRADRIVEQGWRIVRWSSADLDTPRLVANRIRHALSQSRVA
ncbi:hypothetical protein [Williamsia soli]|uniref:hypothetical protein n=1 Tax=Williamsia soli TaxID=364929 RepID=UPI001A9FC235|nr:hypothetical protein [Williamsia soli]